MKKSKRHTVTDQEMRDREYELECLSREENECECEDAWLERFGSDQMTTTQHDYATQRVFDDVITYLASRCKDIEVGYCSFRLFMSAARLASVLSQNFTFTYTEYSWNGTSNDPDDEDAFDTSDAEGCVEPEASNQERVVKALKDYLTLGAAKAKQVNSDALLLWREALMECVFKYHNFGAGATETEVKEFLDKIQKAAQTTWADTQIDQQLKLLTKSPRRGKKCQ